MTEENAKLTYEPAKGNPWYDFMQATIALDDNPKDKKPRGYHWFWGLYFIKGKLPNFELSEIKKVLPDEHWLKEAKIPKSSKILNDLTQNLLKRFLVEIEEINFFKLDFEHTGDFSNFIFPIKVSFNKVKFFPAKFSNAVFFNLVSFNSVEFCGHASFEKTIFCNNADFYKATFSGDARFYDAKFANYASFQGSTFSSSALFYNIKFFGSIINFSDAVFSSIVFFGNTEFFGIPHFHNAKFLKYTNFGGTNFERHAPQFYEATFNDKMSWTGIKLPKCRKHPQDKIDLVGKKLNYKEAKKNYKDRILTNQSVYENIATKLENQKKYHDQHFFFREEMRCRRRLAENFLSRWAYGVYENVSDYGYGVGLVLFWWFLHIILGAIAIFIIASGAGLGFEQARFCSISTSFANANPFVFIGFKEGGLTDCYKVLHYLLPIEFGTIRGVQTFFGIPLLFILLVTLRVRFRLK